MGGQLDILSVIVRMVHVELLVIPSHFLEPGEKKTGTGSFSVILFLLSFLLPFF
jgi:hypothetical protein